MNAVGATERLASEKSDWASFMITRIASVGSRHEDITHEDIYHDCDTVGVEHPKSNKTYRAASSSRRGFLDVQHGRELERVPAKANSLRSPLDDPAVSTSASMMTLVINSFNQLVTKTCPRLRRFNR